MAAPLDAPAGSDYEQRIEQAEIEIDNLRAAFGWSRENSDIELALALASSLQPLWFARGRLREGLAWFDTALTDDNAQHVEVAAAVRARALADKAMLAAMMGAADSLDQAQQALAMARELDDPALLARALTACAPIAVYITNSRWPGRTSPRRSAWPGPWTIGGGSARSSAGRRAEQSWRVTRSRLRAPAEEGRDLAEAIGDGLNSRQCRYCLAAAQLYEGDPAGAAAQFGEVAAEADAVHDELYKADSLAVQGYALACRGETAAARAAADAAVEAAAELGGAATAVAYFGVGRRGPGRRRC